MSEKNIHTGHRQRMKDEFLARGLEGMPKHRALELLLFYAIPQGDVNPLAHDLIDHFGSFSAVFQATPEQLMAVKGVGKNTAALIKLVLAVNSLYRQDRTDLSCVYQHTRQFKDLFEPEFYGAREEQVCIACLDKRFKLIKCCKICQGDTDVVALSSRKVMETALNYNASVVVLAHNHTSGLATPSVEDIQATRHLQKSLRQLDILLYDHIILADGAVVSLRESGHLSRL